MKDVKEIVLFFQNNIKYVPLNIAQELISRYPELGSPIILPVKEDKKAPLIVFNENSDIQLQANFSAVTIVLNHKYFDKLHSLVFDVVDTFEGSNANFKRIGYISSVFMSPKYVSKVKDNFFTPEELEGILEINLSWYRKLETKHGLINCWERLITDSERFKDLLCQYDFNSLVDESINLDMKYIKEFFKVADEFIERRIEKI